MPYFTIKRFVQRKPLVMLAIVSMIASGFLTFFFVHENDKTIMVLRGDVQRLETSIRDNWNEATQSARSSDAAVLVSLLANDTDADQRALKQYYLQRLPQQMQQMPSLVSLVQAADAERTKQLDAINDTYLEKIDVESDIARLEQRNALYAAIAFFLQMAGLVLVVITRDLPEEH